MKVGLRMMRRRWSGSPRLVAEHNSVHERTFMIVSITTNPWNVMHRGVSTMRRLNQILRFDVLTDADFWRAVVDGSVTFWKVHIGSKQSGSHVTIISNQCSR